MKTTWAGPSAQEAPRVHRCLQDNGAPRRSLESSQDQWGPHVTPVLCASIKVRNCEFSGERSWVHREILRKSIKPAYHTVNYLPINKPQPPMQASLCFPEVHGNRPGREVTGSFKPPGNGFIIFRDHLAPNLVMIIQFVSKALCQVSREYEKATFLAFKTL